MKKEINRIAIGSVDIYMQEWTGASVNDIPKDDVIETEANLIGRTKDGGEITYTTTFYSVKSDDGKAGRNEMVDDSASVSFGLITWNGDTITKIIPTAASSTSEGKRRTLIGGVANKNDKIYLIRAVHKDKEKGDVRYTIIGKNVNGFAAAYKPGQETTITPNVSAEPFDDGRLIVLDEDDIDGEKTMSLNAPTAAALSDMTKAELLTFGRTIGAEVSDGMTKAEIVNVINEAQTEA